MECSGIGGDQSTNRRQIDDHQGTPLNGEFHRLLSWQAGLHKPDVGRADMLIDRWGERDECREQQLLTHRIVQSKRPLSQPAGQGHALDLPEPFALKLDLIAQPVGCQQREGVCRGSLNRPAHVEPIVDRGVTVCDQRNQVGRELGVCPLERQLDRAGFLASATKCETR